MFFFPFIIAFMRLFYASWNPHKIGYHLRSLDKKYFILFYSYYTYRINFRQIIQGYLNFLLPEASFHGTAAMTYSEIKFPREFIILNVIKVIYVVHYTVFSAIPFYRVGQWPNKFTSQLIAVNARSNGYATTFVR